MFAMRTADDRVSVLVRDDNPMSGAEANLRLVDLTPTGSLRIAVHRGAFPDAVSTRVAQRLGDVIIDIARDALQSFATSAVPGVAEMRIELVRPHDARRSPMCWCISSLPGIRHGLPARSSSRKTFASSLPT